MFHADGQDGATPPSGRTFVVPPAAKWTFLVLFAMNLLDYIDRWVLSGVAAGHQATSSA